MVRRSDPVRIDSDVDLRVPADRSELSPYPGPVLLAVSAGGALGAGCRWLLEVAVPHPPGGFPWATFAINVAGSLLMGVVIACSTVALLFLNPKSASGAAAEPAPAMH